MAKKTEHIVFQKRTISVYLKDSRVFEYEVVALTKEAISVKVREHFGAIITGGYWHNDGYEFEWWPPAMIKKLKSHNILTNYPDIARGV